MESAEWWILNGNRITYYNQTPLDSKSILYTAFLMLRGMFEWVYVTIKLEGIPSYFQKRWPGCAAS